MTKIRFQLYAATIKWYYLLQRLLW